MAARHDRSYLQSQNSGQPKQEDFEVRPSLDNIMAWQDYHKTKIKGVRLWLRMKALNSVPSVEKKKVEGTGITISQIFQKSQRSTLLFSCWCLQETVESILTCHDCFMLSLDMLNCKSKWFSGFYCILGGSLLNDSEYQSRYYTHI